MKRICIFSIYDNAGIVDRYIYYYLFELTKVAKIIIVVNGGINEEGLEKLNDITNNIYIRNNEGFDAGAYKDCMFNYIGIENLKKYDELILANDTCFGPFRPLNIIFEKMDAEKCDFWGMKKDDYGFATDIQSWFLVFKKNIINDNEFYRYWKDNIDEYENILEKIYWTFERGLYRKLKKLGYKSDVYIHEDGNHNIDERCSSYFGLLKGQIFIKKKIFDDRYYSKDNVYMSLKFIEKNYCYPISLTYEVAKRKYNKIININEFDLKHVCVYNPHLIWSDTDLINLLKRTDNIYLYGAGIWAYITLGFLKDVDLFYKVKCCYVSTINNQDKSINNIPIKKWDFPQLQESDCLIFAVGYDNSKQMFSLFENKKQYVWLWENL